MSTAEDNYFPASNAADAPVKKEYLITKKSTELNLNFVSNKDKKLLSENSSSDLNGSISDKSIKNENGVDLPDLPDDAQDSKRPLDDTNDSTFKSSKRQKKLNGQNKKRLELMNRSNIRDKNEIRLCSTFSGSYGLEEINEIEKCSRGETCKFSHDVDTYMKNKPNYLDDKCYMFNEYGFCGFGHRCRFGESHIDKETNHNLIDKDKFYSNGPNLQNSYKNFLPTEVKFKLRKKAYDFSSLETLGPASVDEREWKRIDFTDKLYLAPLTTVGNLPFRRICKEFGADVTCGEMAVAQSLLEGNQSEWALLKRHASEDFFGVQIVGGNPQVLAKATKLINEYCDIDFLDLNLGCPIDLICRQGAGSSLMTRTNKLNQVITSMSRASSVPLTLKIRTGLNDNKPSADKLINSVSSQFTDGRVALISIHGRSKEARYCKDANWNYIRQCAELSEKIPIFGNGDIFSYKDYEDVMNYEGSKVAGVMIGRGALIKPWIFTEIKEKRDWDISSKERLDIYKKYVNYGLEHFGSDYEGVEKTRKFLLELLSFTCRYIPVGLLEVLPQRINQRPPAYVGRDDLETLFASSYCEDWIKISEMFLGKVKDNFVFLPRHKANAYK